MGLVKPLLFGFIISTVELLLRPYCARRDGRRGPRDHTGDGGISVLILITDLMVTKLLMNIFP